MRLLVVEDEPRISEIIQAALERAEFAVDTVRLRADAQEALANTAYDAAILDLGLPDGDGLNLLAELRPAGNRIPILILTARDAVEQRVLGLDAGADDYLVKPFAMSELVAWTKAVLRRPGAALGPRLRPAISSSIPLVETSALPAFHCSFLVAKLRFWSTCSAARAASYRRAFSKKSSMASTRSSNQMPFRCTCTTCGASCRTPKPARRFIPCAE